MPQIQNLVQGQQWEHVNRATHQDFLPFKVQLLHAFENGDIQQFVQKREKIGISSVHKYSDLHKSYATASVAVQNQTRRNILLLLICTYALLLLILMLLLRLDTIHFFFQ